MCVALSIPESEILVNHLFHPSDESVCSHLPSFFSALCFTKVFCILRVFASVAVFIWKIYFSSLSFAINLFVGFDIQKFFIKYIASNFFFCFLSVLGEALINIPSTEV